MASMTTSMAQPGERLPMTRSRRVLPLRYRLRRVRQMRRYLTASPNNFDVLHLNRRRDGFVKAEGLAGSTGPTKPLQKKGRQLRRPITGAPNTVNGRAGPSPSSNDAAG